MPNSQIAMGKGFSMKSVKWSIALGVLTLVHQVNAQEEHVQWRVQAYQQSEDVSTSAMPWKERGVALSRRGKMQGQYVLLSEYSRYGKKDQQVEVGGSYPLDSCAQEGCWWEGLILEGHYIKGNFAGSGYLMQSGWGLQMKKKYEWLIGPKPVVVLPVLGWKQRNYENEKQGWVQVGAEGYFGALYASALLDHKTGEGAFNAVNTSVLYGVSDKGSVKAQYVWSKERLDERIFVKSRSYFLGYEHQWSEASKVSVGVQKTHLEGVHSRTGVLVKWEYGF